MSINMSIITETKYTTIDNLSSASLSFPIGNSIPLKSRDFSEPSNTGITIDRSDKSESIRPNLVFDRRFRDMAEKVESLPLDKAIKYNALTTIWLLIREIDSNQLDWFEPFTHSDYSAYIGIKWRRGTRSLSFNIENEEQWWSRHWEEDEKIKTGFDTIDYTNLLIHWEWLING